MIVRSAIPVLAVVLEVLWAYPWFALLARYDRLGWDRVPVGLASAVVLAVGAEAITRWSLWRGWPLARARLVALGTASLLLAAVVWLDTGRAYIFWDVGFWLYVAGDLSPFVAAMAFGAYLLWRGISVGRESLTFTGLYASFSVGLVALVVLLVVSGSGPRLWESRQLPASATFYVIAYFAVALLVLATAHLEAVREEMQRQEGASGLYRRWLGLLTGLVASVCLLALVIAGVFSFDVVAPVFALLGVLYEGLVTIFVYVVAYPLGLLVTLLVWVVHALVRSASGEREAEPYNAPDVSDIQKMAHTSGGLPPEVVFVLKVVVAVVVVSAVVALLARALLRRRKDEERDEAEEVEESLWSWDVFKQDLVALVRGLLARFRPHKPSSAARSLPPAAMVVAEGDDRELSVQEIYRGLLREGRELGVPRRQADTPYEYQDKLTGRVSGDAPDVETITEAYVAWRYGGLQPSPARLEVVNRAWRALLSVLKGAGETPRSQG